MHSSQRGWSKRTCWATDSCGSGGPRQWPTEEIIHMHVHVHQSKIKLNIWKYKCHHIYCLQQPNRPFYSCVLSYLAMNGSEAGGDLVLIQTSLLFSCKCKLVSIRTTWFTVQVRDKRPTHTQNARTIFAQTRVEKTRAVIRVCAHLRAFDARVFFCYSLTSMALFSFFSQQKAR